MQIPALPSARDSGPQSGAQVILRWSSEGCWVEVGKIITVIVAASTVSLVFYMNHLISSSGSFLGGAIISIPRVTRWSLEESQFHLVPSQYLHPNTHTHKHTHARSCRVTPAGTHTNTRSCRVSLSHTHTQSPAGSHRLGPTPGTGPEGASDSPTGVGGGRAQGETTCWEDAELRL